MCADKGGVREGKGRAAPPSPPLRWVIRPAVLPLIRYKWPHLGAISRTTSLHTAGLQCTVIRKGLPVGFRSD